MITATISGRVGKDAEIRDAGGNSVCSFSVASSTKVKGEDKTIWTDVTLWGTRGEKLAPYIRKGNFVVVSGELSTREYNGKTYVQLRANDIDLGPKQDGQSRSTETKREPAREPEPASEMSEDDLPF